MAATSGEDHVVIETRWGYHYLLATTADGIRVDLLGRCKLDGSGVETAGYFELPRRDDRFVPTLDELLCPHLGAAGRAA
jgi:hypothetical protein